MPKIAHSWTEMPKKHFTYQNFNLVISLQMLISSHERGAAPPTPALHPPGWLSYHLQRGRRTVRSSDSLDGFQPVPKPPGWCSGQPANVSAASGALKNSKVKITHTYIYIYIHNSRMLPLCLTLIFSISGIKKLYTNSDTISSDWRLFRLIRHKHNSIYDNYQALDMMTLLLTVSLPLLHCGSNVADLLRPSVDVLSGLLVSSTL